MILRGGTYHRGAADIDFLDNSVLVGTGCHGLCKGVQVHDHQVEGFNIEFVEGVDMLLLAAVGQNTGVDARVQGLHTAL